MNIEGNDARELLKVWTWVCVDDKIIVLPRGGGFSMFNTLTLAPVHMWSQLSYPPTFFTLNICFYYIYKNSFVN